MDGECVQSARLLGIYKLHMTERIEQNIGLSICGDLFIVLVRKRRLLPPEYRQKIDAVVVKLLYALPSQFEY